MDCQMIPALRLPFERTSEGTVTSNLKLGRRCGFGIVPSVTRRRQREVTAASWPMASSFCSMLHMARNGARLQGVSTTSIDTVLRG
jgi:hypothetical protein